MGHCDTGAGGGRPTDIILDRSNYSGSNDAYPIETISNFLLLLILNFRSRKPIIGNRSGPDLFGPDLRSTY
ncbi:hypothetical protein C8024_17745 [Sphingopyxis sp. BSNA05]|nr:hypothetical protein [Sphingopyxis sp. BSNA05]